MEELAFGLASLIVPTIAAALGYVLNSRTLARSGRPDRSHSRQAIASIDEAILAIQKTGLSEEQKQEMYRALIEKRVEDLVHQDVPTAAVAPAGTPPAVPASAPRPGPDAA